MDIEGKEIDISEIDNAYEEGLDQAELTNLNKDKDEFDAT